MTFSYNYPAGFGPGPVSLPRAGETQTGVWGGNVGSKNDPYDASTFTADDRRNPPFVNPPLSKLMRPSWDLTGDKLFRGYIVEDNPREPPDRRYRFHFHQNPEVVTEQWEIDLTQLTPELQTAEANTGGIRVNGVTLGLRIRLDRQMDTKRHPNGLLPDLRILAKILTQGVAGPGTNANMLYYSPIRLVLGRAMPFQAGGHAISYGLGCTGYVTLFNISYEKFNRNMVPVMAWVDMGVRVDYYMPLKDATPPPTTNTTRGGNQGAGSKSRISRARQGLPLNVGERRAIF